MTRVNSIVTAASFAKLAARNSILRQSRNRPAIEFFRKHRATLLDDWKTACFDGEALQIMAATR
jgi:hypothetical protein